MTRLALAPRFWSKVVKTDGCWLFTSSLTKTGYGQFHYRRRPQLAHRMAYELEHGPIPAGLGVLHKCDNPPCVNPAHLYLGTDADNVADMVRRGRQARGENHGSSKLTTAEVLEIYSLVGLHEDIARRFGVSRRAVSHIKNGERWSWLTRKEAS